MTKSEINLKITEIINFAGIEKFIDTPVKRYSSGMYVRLAFSIAAHLEPEILIIDEVLAVGDAEFQRKSLGKMDEVTQKRGRTLIFVSHDLDAVKRLCKKAILIDKGEIIIEGSATKVVDTYLDRINKFIPKEDQQIATKNRTGTRLVNISQVFIENPKGERINFATSGSGVVFNFKYNSKGVYNKVNLSFSIHTNLGQNVILHQSKYTNDYFKVKKGDGVWKFKLEKLPLISGTYLINLRIDINGIESDFPREPVYELNVVDGDFYSTGVIPLQHSPILIKGEWIGKR